MNPTPEPEQPSTDNAPNPAAGRNPSPWPMRLAIVVAVIGALCVSGLFVAYRTYDNATKPDRGSPDVVVDNYLRALLDHRDDAEASQYACADQSGLQPIKDFRDSIVRKEAQVGVRIGVSWGHLDQLENNKPDPRLMAQVTQHAVIGGTAQVVPSAWIFTVHKGDGWRVCSAARLPAAPNPSFSP